MKTPTAMQTAILVCVLASGLMAGFFFAFSVLVMRALAALPSAEGIAAMQSINVAVMNPWFFTAFFGTTALCLAAIVVALMRWNDPRAAWALAGGVFYLIGTFAVTVVFNVPRNNALAAASATSSEGAALWSDYLIVWTNWNHVRTIASLASAAAFAIALTR